MTLPVFAQRKAHALHFLGAHDTTAVKIQYRSLSLLLHPDKNTSDPLATIVSNCWGLQNIYSISVVIGLHKSTCHLVLNDGTWKAGVLLTELPSFPL